MTITYTGSNIGLEYDAATATWGLNNTPTEYVDTEAFSSTDPDFVYNPPTTDWGTISTEEEDDFNPCPVGYVYDNELKQCVPDTNYQNPFMQTEQDSGNTQERKPVQIIGTDRFTTDNNFIATREEYEAMSASDLIENLKQRGFVSKDKLTGEFFVDLTRGSIAAGIYDSGLKRVGQSSNLQLDKKKNIVGLLVSKGIMDTTTAYPRGGMSATGDGSDIPNRIKIPTIGNLDALLQGTSPSGVAPGFGNNVFGKLQFDSFMQKKINAFKVVANNSISNYNTYLQKFGVNDIEKEKARKAKFDADISKAKAEREMQQTIRDAEEAQAKKEQQQKEEREIKDFTNLKTGQSTTDSSGDTYTKKDDGGYTFTPSKTNTTTKTYENKRRGGYTGSTAGRGGTSKAKSSPSKPKMTRPNPHTRSGFSY